MNARISFYDYAIHLPSRALSNLKYPDSVRMKYAAMRGFIVNRDDTAFVACHACVKVFKIHREKREKREREKTMRLDHR